MSLYLFLLFAILLGMNLLGIKLLWMLSFLFLLRVLGQAAVHFFAVEWLPGMEHWYSGLIEYRFLLPAQLIIFLVMLKINWDMTFSRGYFSNIRRLPAKIITWLTYVYAGSMVIRYILTMTWYPERRWIGEGTIPIVFHLILASYLYLYAHQHLKSGRKIH